MKLLQLNVTANWGSTGKIAEGIGEAAIARGWESAIAYGRYMNPSQSRLIKVGNKIDVYAHYARNRMYDGEGLGSAVATRSLIRQIEAYDPDVIHLHNIHDYWLNYPQLFKYLNKTNIPVVWTMHDCWAFTGGCAHFTGVDCDKWRQGCGLCPMREGRVDRTARNYKLKCELLNSLGPGFTVVSVSKWLDNLVGQSFLGDNRHMVIYNGVDVAVFDYRRPVVQSAMSEFKDKTVLLGVSSVWPPQKGLSGFIELRKLLPEHFLIVLVGLKAKDIRGLPDGIIGIERTEKVEDLVALYSRADFVVSLSKAETFGMTLAEGLACGTPGVAYNASGTAEVLSGDTGLLFQPGDLASLSKALSAAPVFASDECRSRAVQLFNKNIQFDRYVNLYEEIITKHTTHNHVSI